MKRADSKSLLAKPSAGSTDPAARHDVLTSEEQALWRHVATSVAPIKAKGRVPRTARAIDPVEASGDQVMPPRRPARSKAMDPSKGPNSNVPAPAGDTASGSAIWPPPELADFDPRKARRLGSGRTGIDARIDLHGLRQDEAHTRLRQFLREAHARGHKTVLVITGKGRETDDPSLSYADTLDRQPRGVLRRNVPRWLDEPELRAIVVSYTSAAQRHGGDGAFYVELRRRPR